VPAARLILLKAALVINIIIIIIIINERIEYKLLSLTYKVLTTSQPSYLNNLISVQPAPHRLSPFLAHQPSPH